MIAPAAWLEPGFLGHYCGDEIRAAARRTEEIFRRDLEVIMGESQ